MEKPGPRGPGFLEVTPAEPAVCHLVWVGAGASAVCTGPEEVDVVATTSFLLAQPSKAVAGVIARATTNATPSTVFMGLFLLARSGLIPAPQG
jgi:hypothetical protein